MELRHIRYFLAIAEERNFTRAAAKVGIGQPPLSQQIKDLETEIGTRLFHRLTHGVELTEAGKAFLEIVACMPLQASRAIQAAQRAARGETGLLRVGFTDSALFDTIVATSIRAFRRAFPEVQLHFEEANSGRLTKLLLDENLDVVFLRPESEGRNEGLQLKLVLEEPIIVAVPSGHRAARDEKIELKSLRDEAFILFHHSSGPLQKLMMATFEAAGFQPILGPVASHAGSVLTLVAGECGVALLPKSLQRSQMEGVVFRDLAGAPPTIGLAIACRRGDQSKIVRNFVSSVSTAAASI